MVLIEMQTAFAASLTDSLSRPIVSDSGLKLNPTDIWGPYCL